MSTMRALTFQAPGEVRVADVPAPTIVEAGDAVIRVEAAAICGTDLHPYHGRLGLEPGFVMGHEYLGTVEEVGGTVSEIEVGDRVVGSFIAVCGHCWYCNRGDYGQCSTAAVFGLGMAFGDIPGAQAERLRVPRADLTLRRIPERSLATDTDFLFVGDILTTAYDALRRAGMRPGDVVAIVGAGPVGVCCAEVARATGAGVVVVIDPVEARLRIAERFGAVAVNPQAVDVEEVVLDLTGWRGADVVVDAVGHQSALEAAVPLVRPGGALTIPGAYTEGTTTLPGFTDLWLKHVRVVMGIGDIPGNIDEVMALVAQGRLSTESIVTHRMGLSEAEQAYELFDAKVAFKVVLDPRR